MPNFVDWLGDDISAKILTYLDDPTDIVRVSSVSKLWHRFVIEKGLCRQLCLRRFPELRSSVDGIESNNMIEASESSELWESMKRKNRIYSFMARGLSPVLRNDCILAAISASSTDNYPIESVHNTLVAMEGFDNAGSSYWSSGGESDPTVPETLLYQLTSGLCFVTEIHIQPFQAYFQFGFPIYSCKDVRFRMGHVGDPEALERAIVENDLVAHDDRFVWTYVSPVFPVAQASVLQKFKLPEPALCLGGFLMVELLGRQQRQDIDGLFYVCIAHVQVVGRPLVPPFKAEMAGPTGKYSLKYNSEIPSSSSSLEASPMSEVGESSRLRSMLLRFVSSMISVPPFFYANDESEEENS